MFLLLMLVAAVQAATTFDVTDARTIALIVSNTLMFLALLGVSIALCCACKKKRTGPEAYPMEPLNPEEQDKFLEGDDQRYSYDRYSSRR